MLENYGFSHLFAPGMEEMCSCDNLYQMFYFIDRGNDNWLIKYENTPVVERTTCLESDESDCQVCLEFWKCCSFLRISKQTIQEVSQI